MADIPTAPDAREKLAALKLHPRPADVAEVTGPTSAIPALHQPLTRRTRTVADIRRLFVTKSYELLTDVKVWKKLKAHCLSENPKISLEALTLLVESIATVTRSEEGTPGSVTLNLISHIPRPQKPPIDVTP